MGFLPCMDYFTETKEGPLLGGGIGLDKGFIHKIYY